MAISLFFLFCILHGDLICLCFPENNNLDTLAIFTRFQVPIMDFEFSTGENVVFPIETFS